MRQSWVRCGAGWVPLLVIGAGVATAAERPGPADMVVTAQLEGVSHVLYEPVVVTYQLTNPTTEAIETELQGMNLVDRSINFEIQCEGGERKRFYAGVLGCSIGSQRVTHQPGEVLVGSTSMFFNDLTRELAFPAVGTCTLWARMFLGNLPGPIYVEAAPVAVEIRAPGSDDQNLIEYVGGRDRLVVLLKSGPTKYCEGRSAGGCVEDLRRVGALFPASAYAPHIVLSLGSALAWEGLKVSPREQLRVEVLSEFLARWPEHPLAPNATAALIDSLKAVGRVNEAQEWSLRFQAKYPRRIPLLHLESTE